ncbi:MAG: translocation/assembly module TamB domain-containing protein, partial [candidate division Zixibacteria bacterium]|nr:translocation/assembly module TamB domain-containing protein [candidate division Zixibacteria bacterium]
TRMRDRSVGGVGSGYTRLDLIIGGTLMQPSINAAAGSSYTDEDIVGMLLLNSPASASRQEVMEASPLEERILDVLGVSLSRQITRFIGVEQFEIIPAYGQDQQLSGAEISLGFYTAPNLYTYLSSPLSFIGQTEVGFEYRFGRHFFLGGNRDRDNLYHLNLNLNWEIK